MNSGEKKESLSKPRSATFSIGSLESNFLPSLFANEGIQDAKKQISRQQMQTFFNNLGKS